MTLCAFLPLQFSPQVSETSPVTRHTVTMTIMLPCISEVVKEKDYVTYPLHVPCPGLSLSQGTLEYCLFKYITFCFARPTQYFVKY